MFGHELTLVWQDLEEAAVWLFRYCIVPKTLAYQGDIVKLCMDI